MAQIKLRGLDEMKDGSNIPFRQNYQKEESANMPFLHSSIQINFRSSVYNFRNFLTSRFLNRDAF